MGLTVETVQSILRTYSGRITIRQLYYRLVAGGHIPNSVQSYQSLVNKTSRWRKDNLIPFEAFADMTRGMIVANDGATNHDPSQWAKAFLNSAIQLAKNYELKRWWHQDTKIIVAVEKQALQGVFAPICKELQVDLAVMRGYPSLSFLLELSNRMSEEYEDMRFQSIVILYYGDYDPSGMNIPQTVERNLQENFIQDFELIRMALTKEQVDRLDLIPAPVKMKDSRSLTFIANHGTDVYELDAIDPDELQTMIRGDVSQYFDISTDKERIKLSMEGQKYIGERMDLIEGLIKEKFKEK